MDHCIVLDLDLTKQILKYVVVVVEVVVSQFAEIFIRQYQFLSTGDTNKYSEASRNRVSSSSP